MSSIEIMINACKYLRSSITRQYNSKDSLSSLSEVERIAKREKFKGILVEIRDYDSRIRNIKWSDSINEDEFTLELSTYEIYIDQLNEILAILTDRPNVANESSSRSLLKNPIIPLPFFNSSPE